MLFRFALNKFFAFFLVLFSIQKWWWHTGTKMTIYVPAFARVQAWLCKLISDYKFCYKTIIHQWEVLKKITVAVTKKRETGLPLGLWKRNYPAFIHTTTEWLQALIGGNNRPKLNTSSRRSWFPGIFFNPSIPECTAVLQSHCAVLCMSAASRGSGWRTWQDELLVLCHEG